MAGGRPARPVQLKLLEGRGAGRDSGGRKVAPTAPFKRIPPNPPTWLTREAKAEWKRVVPELARLELLRTIDRGALAAYCECWSRFVAAQALIKRDGLLGENSQGTVRHPAVAILEAASKELRAWASEFGLTPAAEHRVGKKEQPDGGDEDPFD